MKDRGDTDKLDQRGQVPASNDGDQIENTDSTDSSDWERHPGLIDWEELRKGMDEATARIRKSLHDDTHIYSQTEQFLYKAMEKETGRMTRSRTKVMMSTGVTPSPDTSKLSGPGTTAKEDEKTPRSSLPNEVKTPRKKRRIVKIEYLKSSDDEESLADLMLKTKTKEEPKGTDPQHPLTNTDRLKQTTVEQDCNAPMPKDRKLAKPQFRKIDFDRAAPKTTANETDASASPPATKHLKDNVPRIHYRERKTPVSNFKRKSFQESLDDSCRLGSVEKHVKKRHSLPEGISGSHSAVDIVELAISKQQEIENAYSASRVKSQRFRSIKRTMGSNENVSSTPCTSPTVEVDLQNPKHLEALVNRKSEGNMKKFRKATCSFPASKSGDSCNELKSFISKWRDEHGGTLLHWICRNRKCDGTHIVDDFIHYLKDFAPELLFVHDNMMKLPLHIAIEKGEVCRVLKLLQHGSPIVWQDGNGLTPLEIAYIYGHRSVLKLLLNYGASFHDLLAREEKNIFELDVLSPIFITPIADGLTPVFTFVHEPKRYNHLPGAKVPMLFTYIAVNRAVPGKRNVETRELLSDSSVYSCPLRAGVNVIAFKLHDSLANSRLMFAAQVILMTNVDPKQSNAPAISSPP
ncbi:unnamed protein product [Nippostrongylus brasiliensis]|uniref:ANK_REP_REGION domain-containing protein n=1 Tax=Nippostrongylus brasiliensis TaxID=27835 RepID=A0A0N4Y7C6_NIPBR|nr:unnamed protein product [Nippostrongylus brasiliensis]